MQVALSGVAITTDYSVAKCFAKHEHWCLSQGTSLDQAIKLSSTYFDDKSKTKLLILISDGEDHSEGARSGRRSE
jgi:Ca-activated chloride channel family protein